MHICRPYFKKQSLIEAYKGKIVKSGYVTPLYKQKKCCLHCLLTGFVGLLLLSDVCIAADRFTLKNETDKINYSIGHQIGTDFSAQGISLNPEALTQGIQDAISKNEPLLTKAQMNTVLVELKKKIMAEQQLKSKQAKAEYRQLSEAFLKENAKKSDVTVLPDGVQYKVLKEGNGRKPAQTDEVRVNYRISRVDGKEIGTTYNSDAPKTFSLAKAIPGLREVLPLMSEGAKWQIVIANNGRDPIDDLGAMIYEMELIEVITAK
jgi:FKBP-type peptidyl-prolyl cis-trans isomerase